MLSDWRNCGFSGGDCNLTKELQSEGRKLQCGLAGDNCSAVLREKPAVHYDRRNCNLSGGDRNAVLWEETTVQSDKRNYSLSEGDSAVLREDTDVQTKRRSCNFGEDILVQFYGRRIKCSLTRENCTAL